MGITPDPTKLTEEQRQALETYQQREDQLQALEDIAKMTQEVVNILDDKSKDKSVDNLGVLLTDIRESLSALKDKEAPETPDYAKPVVEAVSKLEKALSASIKGINFKPEIKVDAPAVNVSPPGVDLKGVERAVSGLSKSFQDAIKQIPKTEIPEQDFSPLLEAWEGISEQLQSIDTASRMKPTFPTQLKVVNPDGTTIGGTVWGLNDKEDTGTYVYFGFSAADGSWKILRKTIATNVFRYSTGASDYSTAWTNRASQSYATYDATF